MPLIHETGAGLAGAESYASVQYATTYHGARGNAAWADADLDVQESSLRKATDYIEATYGPRFAGTPLTPTQGLSVPRQPSPLGNVVPAPASRATAELALKVISGVDLFPDAAPAVAKEKIDVIETTYITSTGPRFPFVDALLAPLLKPSGAAGSVAVKLFRV